MPTGEAPDEVDRQDPGRHHLLHGRGELRRLDEIGRNGGAAAPRRGEWIGRVETIPRVAERGPRPRRPAQRRTSVTDLPKQEGISRSVGDVVVPDATIEVEHSLIVRVDRGLDAVMAARIAHRAGEAVGRTEKRRDRTLTRSRIARLIHAFSEIEPSMDIPALEEWEDLHGPARVIAL